MPNVTRLGKGATQKIHDAIDMMFDNASVRLLGPQSIQGKKIYITFDRTLSLPGIFEAGSIEEAVKPDLEVLESLIRVSAAYIEGARERTKARVVHEINGSIASAKHMGGMLQSDFRDLVNAKLSEVWADVTRNIHTIVDTEIAHAKNVSVLDGVIGANLNAGVDDPVVYFVVVRDQHLCDECKRLHLMDDEVTPRLWYLSELGHGYHKKGEDSPKIGGLHPHCRCTLVTLLPGYGFTKDGKIKFVKRNYLALDEQRSMGKSESFAKSDWHEEDHPRDPETGEFIAYDPRLDDPDDLSLLEGDLAEPGSEEHINDALTAIRGAINEGSVSQDRTSIKQMLEIFGIWPDDESTQEKYFTTLGALKKAAPKIPSPTGLLGRDIRTQIANELRADPSPWGGAPSFGIMPFARLLYHYKLHPLKPEAQLLRYIVHRIENRDSYKTLEGAQSSDSQFYGNMKKLFSMRRKADMSDELWIGLARLKTGAFANAHLIDALAAHRKSLHAHLKDKTIDIDGEPHVVLVRGLTHGNRRPDPSLASYSDTKQTVGGQLTNFFYHAVPLKNVWYSYDFGPTEAWNHPRRKAEDEFLVSSHELKPAKEEQLKKLVERKPRPTNAPSVAAQATVGAQ